jgi:hypothetical protein
MRKYLGWEAKSMVAIESYLGFKTDWTVKNDIDEARDFVKDADMLIFQDNLINVDGLDLQEIAGHHNTIITGTGSPMRMRTDQLLQDQLSGWAIIPPISDETIATRMCGTPFENVIVPIERILEITNGIKKNKKLSICHAPTKTGMKGTEIVEEILKPYEKEGKIEYIRIQGMSWEESLQEKAKCHIILDSFGPVTRTYGAGNALEGLVLKQTVVSKISPWAYALHPDLPITTTWGKNESEVIKNTIEWESNDCNEIGKEIAMRWVKRNFSAKYQIRKWKNYIDWVMTK